MCPDHRQLHCMPSPVSVARAVTTMSATGRPRLLIYTQDGLGLGHLRRTTLLASDFLAARPAGSVLTICDSPTGQFFDAAPGHDYLKLPSVRKTRPGEWSPVSLALEFPDVLEMRTEMIRTTATAFQPDVLLVDHMPHGAMGELLPTLEALESSPTRIVLGLRDILDAPETIQQRWRLEGAFEAVDRFFDDVLVYGCRDVFDVARQYDWPPRLLERLHYCGYVCSPGTMSETDPIRRRHLDGLDGGKLIVAMAGGGADGYPVFEALVRAVPAVTARHPCALLLVTGPFLAEGAWAQLRELADAVPVQIVRTVDDPLAYMAAADLVVAMAGYNTTAEILKVRARALLVPRAGPSAEQQMRASRLAARGCVHWLHPDALTAERLAGAVLAALEEPPGPATDQPDLLGLQRAARHLVAASTASAPTRRGQDPGMASVNAGHAQAWAFDGG